MAQAFIFSFLLTLHICSPSHVFCHSVHIPPPLSQPRAPTLLLTSPRAEVNSGWAQENFTLQMVQKQSSNSSNQEKPMKHVLLDGSGA